MTSIRTYATQLILKAATLAAIGAALILPGQVSAAPTDGPWPEPPSCSNETGTCASMEDIVAYECFFEMPNSPFNFCDDPFAELMRKDIGSFVAPQAAPDLTPSRLAVPTARR